MRQQVDDLKQTGVATVTPIPTEPLTRRQIIEELIAMFEERGDEQFPTLGQIEYQSEKELRASSSDGTVLEPMVIRLNELGRVTEPNIGSFTDQLDITLGQLHHVTCSCHSGATIAGHDVAVRLRTLLLHEPRKPLYRRIGSSIRSWLTGS